jgi:hypothetical protein
MPECTMGMFMCVDDAARRQVIELFPPPPNELAFFMVRVVDSGRKGRIGVETQVTIHSKQVRRPSCLVFSRDCGGGVPAVARPLKPTVVLRDYRSPSHMLMLGRRRTILMILKTRKEEAAVVLGETARRPCT